MKYWIAVKAKVLWNQGKKKKNEVAMQERR